MKKFRFLIFIALIMGCALAFVGCGGGELITPRGLRINSDTLELSWYAVPDARYYSVEINGNERDTRKNTYSLTSLSAGNYTIRVKAYGADDTESDWSAAIRFVREEEPGFGFALINGNREYEVTGLGSLTGDVTVPDTYRGKPVTSIGRRAFANRTKLTGITLGNNITNIGEQAFYNCSYLTHVNIPSGVTAIGNQAFQSCRLLTGELVIPDAVTEIGDGAFAYCHAVTDITIGKNVKTIGDNAFADCENLQSIVLPDNVESIGEYAFSKCINASSLSMGSGLKSIGARAFYGCEKLTTVAIGKNVETVGEYAFSDSIAVESVSIPNSVLTIGDGAFRGCVALSDVSLGRNVESIGVNAFYDTAFWKPETEEDSVEDENTDPLVYVGTDDRKWLVGVRITSMSDYDEFIAQDIYAVGGGAFYRHAKLTSVRLPDSVQLIDSYAFYGCPELLSVIAGSGVKKIGERAFSSCVKLRLLTLGVNDGTELVSSLSEIGNYAFSGCTVLGENLKMPDSLRVIGTGAFNNTALWNTDDPISSVVYADTWVVGLGPTSASQLYPVIKSGTKGIANYAFYGSVLFNVILPSSVEYIGRGAFSECRVLRSVTLPDTLQTIEDYTFYHCAWLSVDELPQSLVAIGRSAFYGCKNLGAESRELKIPVSVRTIGDYAFYGCGDTSTPEEGETGATEYIGAETLVIQGNGNTEIGEYAFANFVSLKEVQIGDGVTLMGQRAFYKCTRLQQVSIGASLTEIADRAFYGCTSLGKDIVVNGIPYVNRVVIPDNIVRIGNYAFYRNESLSYFELGEGVTEIGDYAFYGCTGLTDFNLKNTESIGKQAFRNCARLTSIVVSDKVTKVDMHAFYGCTTLTLYIEHESMPIGWEERWNSSYRPVVWGVELSEDDSYLVSITKGDNNIVNHNEKTSIYDPSRAGYEFYGWSLSQDGTNLDDYVADVTRVPNGTKVYAVWVEAE